MELHDAFAWMNARRTTEVVVTPAGSGTRAWYDVTHDVTKTFYLNASMGLVSMFGAGLALNAPEAHVWAIAGDGGVLMNPGAFLTEAEFQPPNLKHIILWNKVFHASGRIPLGKNGEVDFARIANGFGVPEERTFTLGTMDDLENNAAAFSKEFGYALIVLRINIDLSRRMGDKPHVDAPELKYLFGRQFEKDYGVTIFDQAGV